MAQLGYCYEHAEDAPRLNVINPEAPRQIGWLYGFAADSYGKENEVFVWLDDYPEAPVDGCVPVFVGPEPIERRCPACDGKGWTPSVDLGGYRVPQPCDWPHCDAGEGVE
jgi:hypothetical protein